MVCGDLGSSSVILNIMYSSVCLQLVEALATHLWSFSEWSDFST